MKHLFVACAALAVFIPSYAYAAPIISNGAPTGILPADVGSVTLKVDTDELAHCKYASAAGTTYASMSAFGSGTSTTHLATVTVQNDTRYDFYIKCQDLDGNITATDYNVYFGVARGTPPDVAAPVISEVSPAGTYAAGTSALSLTLRTDENASCRYGPSSAAFGSLPYTFGITGGNVHTAPLAGLKEGTEYKLYVRCEDPMKNANSVDQVVTFTIATSSASSITPQLPPPLPIPVTVPVAKPAVSLKFSKDMKYGMKDLWVLLLQLYLAQSGHYTGPYDSVFGDRTLAAVKAFQRSKGIPATGFVGPLTRVKLNALIK